MLCIIEIAMTIFGIVTLTKGTISFSRRRVVTGGPAYLIGMLLTITFPLVLGLGLVYGVLRAAQGENVGEIPLSAILIDVGTVAIIAVGCAVIAAVCGKDPTAVEKESIAVEGELRPPPDPDNPYAR